MGRMSEHEHSFPASTEPVERISERSITAVEYEERERLGFRRVPGYERLQSAPLPARYRIETEPSALELSGEFFGAMAMYFGLAAIVYAPLPMAVLGVVSAQVALATGERAAASARRGLAFAITGFVLGVAFALLTGRSIWF